MKMDSYWMFGYILVFAVVTLTSKVISCPSECTCLMGEARCVQINLYTIPSSIPWATRTLDLKNNKITDLYSTSFRDLPNLVNLQLANNLIEVIDNLAFRNLTHLQTLDLSGNRLTAVNFETFKGTPNLIDLNLASNRIYYIRSAFKGLKQLTRLKLSGNELPEISEFDFQDLVGVQQLDLSRNHISKVHPQAFAKLRDILSLDMKQNTLVTLGKLNFTCESLNFIDMSECNLTRIPRYFPSSVNYLQLQRNNLTVIRRDDFRYMQHLERLILDENQIYRIEKFAFHGTVRLQELWLNKNQLKRIPTRLPNSVQTLLLESNQISEIETWTFDSNNKIKQISLMDNTVTYIDWNALHPLKKLDELDLSNNKLKMLTTNLFLGLKSLKVLNLAKNPIEYFYPHCFQGLIGLKTLNLAYIRLDHALIADNSFIDLNSLKKLTIDSSQGIANSVFNSKTLLNHLKSVSDLSMQSTELVTIPPYFLSYFPKLEVFHISSSVFHCDSRLVWFKSWLLNTTVRIIRPRSLTCFTPIALYNRAIIDLKDSDFIPATTSKTTARQSSATFPKLPKTTVIPKPIDTQTWKPYTTTTKKPAVRSTTLYGDNYYGFETQATIESPSIVTIGPYQSTNSPKEFNSKRDAEGTGNSGSGTQYNKTTIIIVAISITVTLIVFVLVIVIIIMMKRRDRKKDEYKNAVKYKHRNNVLYFMPKSEATISLDGTIMSNSSSKEGTLSTVPGRDITQEGPLRVYKWEDF